MIYFPENNKEKQLSKRRSDHLPFVSRDEKFPLGSSQISQDS